MEFFLRNPVDVVTTTDATVTTVSTIPIENDAVRSLFIFVVGRRQATGDSATYVITGAVKRSASGAATIVGLMTIFAREDVGATTWNANVVVSGNDMLIQVQGQAAATVDWRVEWQPTDRS